VVRDWYRHHHESHEAMSRSVTFTQAQVRRAIKAAESAGLRVRQVTVKPDGSIVIDSRENDIPAMDSPRTSLASWDDV
jgi:hypothetical protein